MWDSICHCCHSLIGDDGRSANLLQVALRALIVYGGTLFVVRLGKKRFMGQNSAFDVVLLFILGSVLSRGVNGTAPMLTTLAAGFVLIGAHWVASYLSFQSHWLGDLIKGHTEILIQDGLVQHENARLSHITQHDLMEGLRQAGVDDISRVKLACLERSGRISVILRH